MAKSPKNHSKPLNWIFKFLIDLEPVVVLRKNVINPTNRYRENYTHRDETQWEVTAGKKRYLFHVS